MLLDTETTHTNIQTQLRETQTKTYKDTLLQTNTHKHKNILKHSQKHTKTHKHTQT